jgi:hypothetical protein
MKKKKIHWKKIVLGIGVALCLAALAFGVLFLYRKLSELANQMTYLQDTTNVILSDVGNLQSNFEKTLAEENSMIESYSIEVTDMDFARGTYHVQIAVIPKEYTDETQVSVYFGTMECQLTANGYTYEGTMTLPLEKTFDGNLTFLLANGRKKNTEVIEDYEGLYNHLEQVLTGSLADDVTYRDGTVSLDSTCSYALDGGGIYEFDSFKLVIEVDGEEIGSINLLQDAAGTTDELQSGDTEAETDAQQIELPVSGLTGTHACKFSYDLQAEEEALPENPQIRAFLRAESTEGYRFECEVSGGDARAVYDRKGGKYDLSDNEITEE